MASVEDIGAMKIHAAVSRNAKKDYDDVYELLNVYKFADLIRFYSAMYPNHDVIFALKFMTDFSELENEEEPVSLKEVSWPEITNKISTEIKNYVQTLQQKRIDADNEKQRREKNNKQKKKITLNGC